MRKSRRRKERRRQLLSLFLCAAMTVSLWPAAAFADSDTETQTETVSETEVAEGELCTNHPEHTEDCYELVELPCTHEHTEECYDPDDLAERVASASDWEDLEPVECSHVCSVESGCLEEELNCSHVHTEDCRALTGDAEGEEETELMSLGLDGNDVLRSTKDSMDNKLAIQIGTNAIDDPNGAAPGDYLYFGSWNGKPVKWRVLDADQTSTGEYEGIFLLSENVLEDAVVDMDGWNSSFENGGFTSAEAGALADTYAENSVIPWLFNRNWNAGEVDGKVFSLSASEMQLLTGKDCLTLDSDSGFVAGNGGGGIAYWLRSWVGTPDNPEYGYVDANGYVQVNTYQDAKAGARPAINLNTSSLAFTTPADNSGHYENFSRVGNYTGKEWKAVLCDDTDFSEDFWLSGGSLTLPAGYAAETLTFNHPSLASANTDYTNLTAMLMDGEGNVLWYGSVNDDPSAASSSLTVPAGLSTGTYTLYLLGEQWNEEGATDYVCGKPYRTTLTVGENTEEGFAEQVLYVSGNTAYDCDLTVTLDGENGSPEYRCWIPGGTGWSTVKFLNGSHTFTLSSGSRYGASVSMVLPVGTVYTVSYTAGADLPDGTRLTVADTEQGMEGEGENLLTVEQDLEETRSFQTENYVVRENTGRFLNFYFFQASEMAQIVIGKMLYLSKTVDVKVDAAPGQNLGAIMEEMRKKYEAMTKQTVTEQTVTEEPVKFVFDLQLTDMATGSAYTGACYLGSDTSTAFYPDENGIVKISLAAGDACTVSVPASVTYTLTEENAEGYSFVNWSYRIKDPDSEVWPGGELYDEDYQGTALRGRDYPMEITAWNQETGKGRTGNISVSKHLELFHENIKIEEWQLSGLDGYQFPFTIRVWMPGAEDSADVDGTYKLTKSYSSLESQSDSEELTIKDGVGNFTLDMEQTVLISGLPAGAKYEISEGQESSGYFVFNHFEQGSLQSRQGEYEIASGTVLSGKMQAWTAVNNLKEEAGNLRVSKYVTSSNPADLRREFRFRITLQDLADSTSKVSVGNVNDRYETSQTFSLEAGEGLLLLENPEDKIAPLSEDLSDERNYQDVRSSGQLTFDENGVAYVKLHSGDILNLNRIPYGSSYKVEEILDSGAVCTVLVNGSLAVTETSGSEKLAKTEGTVGFATDATFDNIVSRGILTLSKEVVNKSGHEDETYAFTVKLTDRYGKALKGTCGVIYSDDETRTMKNRTLADGTLTESLADGSYLMIVGLPDGAKYTVTETASDAYTTEAANGVQTVSGSAISGSVSIGTPEEIAFTNTWPEPTPEPTPDPEPETPDTPDGGGSETPDTPDSGGSETPDTPTTPTTPTPGSKHHSGGGGGGSSSHSVSTGTVTGGPGVATSSETQTSSGTGTTGDELVEIVHETGTGGAEAAPAGGLPKTGQEGGNWLLLLLSALSATVFLFFTGEKKKHRR